MGKDYIAISSRVDHPYALRAFEVYDIESSAYQVSEGFSGEELYKHIWPSANKFTESETAKIGF